MPAECESALKKARQYSDTVRMSKAGFYDQLTSECGERLAQEEADYPIANLQFTVRCETKTTAM